MKLGVSLYSFAGDLQTGQLAVDDALRYCAAIGCEGVELIGEQHIPNWPNTKMSDLDHIKDLCRELGLEIFCFSYYMNALGHYDRRATMNEYLEMVKSGAATAAYLGTKIMRPAFYGVPVENMIDMVKAGLPIAEKYGVIWGVELHAPFPPAYYIDALEKINSPWFRLIPDFSCWQTAGAAGHFQANDVETIIPLLKWTVHCHGKGHVFDEYGEEPNTPYKDLMNILKKYGYEGAVVAENEGWITNYKPTLDVVKTHFKLLERYGR